jgi:hypothetical protein
LLVAADWLAAEQAPGVWVDATWVDTANRALALALSGPTAADSGCIHVNQPGTRSDAAPFDLGHLHDWLAGKAASPLLQNLGELGVLEWRRAGKGQSLSPGYAA